MTENLKALALVDKLTAEKMEEIESVLQNKPLPNKDWGRGFGRNAP